MAANGIVAWLTRADTPTPAISYAVVHKGADAGIVITASHNAPRYNGLKLKAPYGGSASPEQARQVESFLERNQERMHGPNLIDFDLALEEGRIRNYSYEVYQSGEKIAWYDPYGHPDRPELASSFPHHKHVPPDIKHNRVPAPEISFAEPNVPRLVEAIARDHLGRK